MYKLYAIKYINHERGNSICVSKIFGKNAEDAARSLFGSRFGEFFWTGVEVSNVSPLC